MTITSSTHQKPAINESMGLDKSQDGIIPQGPIDKYLSIHAHDDLKNLGFAFYEIGNSEKIRPELLVCIAKADSGLGTRLKTAYNLGNVGNNDRGDTKAFASWRAGIEAIARTLNNKALGHYDKVGQLSRGGGNKTGSIYASSPYNWHKNVTTCLSEITGEQVGANWHFRL